MYTALWLEPGIPLLYRHQCGDFCSHGLEQTESWLSLNGLQVEREALATPSQGVVVTRYYSGERYFANQAAGLAFKVVLSGQELFEIEGGIHRLNPGQALVINPSRDYASTIGADNSQTFCVSYGSRLVAEARWAWKANAAEALEGPDDSPPPLLLERVYGSDAGFDAYLRELLLATHELDRDRLEDTALALLDCLLEHDQQGWQYAEELDIRKESLRREALQRLHRARDYMESTWNSKATLDDWAQVACMSRFHFLRLFRSAFGETPRQYYIRRRLERAGQMLLETEENVTEISLECGFESLSHFSNAFRRHFGVSPQGRLTTPKKP